MIFFIGVQWVTEHFRKKRFSKNYSTYSSDRIGSDWLPLN